MRVKARIKRHRGECCGHQRDDRADVLPVTTNIGGISIEQVRVLNPLFTRMEVISNEGQTIPLHEARQNSLSQ